MTNMSKKSKKVLYVWVPHGYLTLPVLWGRTSDGHIVPIIPKHIQMPDTWDGRPIEYDVETQAEYIERQLRRRDV